VPFFKVNGCRLYYTVQGQGTPILFIHPPLLTHFNFVSQTKKLSKSFQIITFDIRGHGRSSYSRQPLTYPLIAEDMKELLDHLKIQRAFICGYSTGGSIALEFFLSHPDRAYGEILISGLSEITDRSLIIKLNIATTLIRFKIMPLLSLFIFGSNMNTISSFWKVMREGRKGSSQNIEQYYRYSLTYNCTNQLEKIKTPVLLVYGLKDQGFFRYAQLLHEKLPHNELKWIRDVKHQIPTKAADELNDLIKQFINSQNRCRVK
jgi:Predicted hydrolases or acyltransferases (alpha/beta hydrolase superfamily)